MEKAFSCAEIHFKQQRPVGDSNAYSEMMSDVTIMVEKGDLCAQKASGLMAACQQKAEALSDILAERISALRNGDAQP
ncbi:hypothetical protein [Bombella pollinis]|uniref:Uncharacterized protein n=1 Tax=Bombella pollinis TaxID=2967337 RepID=A0ABT3WR32_9PROT|nr:hypothetical protein [Bombella pollinis]MCX5620113.1 hypothetical protein [Bombella pollinis]